MNIIKFIKLTTILTFIFSTALKGQGSTLSNSEKKMKYP